MGERTAEDRDVGGSNPPLPNKKVHKSVSSQFGMARVIVAASGKGGVGKTTVAVNLAIALHMLGRRVLLIDANLTTPNAGIHLGVFNIPVSLHDVLSGKAKPEQATYKHPYGFYFLPASLDIRKLTKTMEKRLIQVINKLMDKFDYVIIDAAPGLGKEAQLALEAGDELIVVTNAEMPAVVDALKTIELAKIHNTSILGVVINKHSGRNEMTKENVEEFLETPVIGVIREDPKVKLSLRRKVPMIISSPSSKFSRDVMNLARTITGMGAVKESFFGSILRRLGF